MSENDKPVIVRQGQEDRDTGQSGGMVLVTGVGARPLAAPPPRQGGNQRLCAVRQRPNGRAGC